MPPARRAVLGPKVGILKGAKSPSLLDRARGFLRPVLDTRPCVRFSNTVVVTECKPSLGLGTLPADGTLLAIGLGQPVRTIREPLATTPAAGQRPIEDRAWVPSRERARRLKKCLGKGYLRASLRQRLEARRLRAARKETKNDGKHHSLMPSPEEAKTRAQALARDCAGAQSAQKRPFPFSPSDDFSPCKRRALASGWPCHHCAQPTGAAKSCSCLAAAAHLLEYAYVGSFA